MDDYYILGEDLPLPPARLFERLALLPGYIWDQAIDPVHSTYDNWHVAGIRHTTDHDAATPFGTSSGTQSITRDSPRHESRPPFRHHWRSSFSETSSEISNSRVEQDPFFQPVIARISSHVVRLEREYHMLRSIIQISDPECLHTIRPIDIVRLNPEPGDPGPILVAIFEAPGWNSLKDIVAFGPAWFTFNPQSESSTGTTPGEQVSLPVFLDFAIGACDCLELLHFGLKAVHGEIRPDAFHFNRTTGRVKLANTGNGARSFDNALSEGWSALSRELGVKAKLQFIAPEQTGRMPTEPDSRTDIYTLGVLFWIMLVGKPAFTGATPVEVVQNVLGKKLPPLSSKRMDIPDAVSAVVTKMTHKALNERYHTITSVKKDLEQISKLLGDGDTNALKTFEVAQNDVSSFFTLPSQMFGREEEYQKVISIAEKVHRRQQARHAKVTAQGNGNSYLGSTSSISESRAENLDIGEGSSDSGSLNYIASRHNSTAGMAHGLSHMPTLESIYSNESSLSTQRGIGTRNRTRASIDYRSTGTGDNADRDSSHVSIHTTQSPLDALNPLNRHKPAHKTRHYGQCEIITIAGNPGIGKSDLIQRVQPVIRKMGYIGVARLDRARRIPFGAFAKVLASVLRQIFSERDVTTEYHQNVRAFLRPLWSTLCQVLDLPEQLISVDQNETPASPKIGVAQHLLKESLKPEISKRPSFLHGSASVEMFRSGTANKNMRLMEIYLEILRYLCTQKLICVCLDDLQYADDETIDLVVTLWKTRIPCLLILAARRQEIESRSLLSIFDAESTSITKIDLRALSEEDVARYVAVTMQLPPSPKQTPLSVTVIEKSQGNPFFMRMMLETCYRKNCIWYSWRHSKWEFDIDRIFTEFVSPEYGDSLGTDFIIKRFQEFPPAILAILIWATFLGSPFSFSLIQKLIEGEFWYTGDDDTEAPEHVTACPRILLPRSEAEIVSGLQFLVQGYLILPGETDDEFRFAHDRFAQAVSTLSECHDVEKMHYVIAKTMMKYCTGDEDIYSRSHHICRASDLIRKRVKHRSRYRKTLCNAARVAMASGARPTALWYSRHALKLLQTNCWSGKSSDVDYEETLQLHTTTAELLWYQGENEESLQILAQILQHAKTPADRSKPWIIKSRVSTHAGDFNGAMDSLLSSLEELNFHVRQPKSLDQYDASFLELKDYLMSNDLEKIISQPACHDPRVVAIGNVLAEAMAVAFWGDDLTYMYMGVEMMRLHLFTGRLSQIGLACCHLAMVAYTRHNDLEFAARMSDLSLLLFDTYADPTSRNYGFVLQSFLIEHLKVPLRSILPFVETSLEYAFTSTEIHLMLMSFGLMASTRLYLGQDMSEIEAFCTEIPEELTDWMLDVRGGSVIVSVKQVARALQGKTSWRFPDLIMTDDKHITSDYMDHVQRHAMRADRPQNIYWGLAMIPLFAYGHYDKIIELGTDMMESIERLWSLRISHLVHFFLPLAILTQHLDDPKKEGFKLRMELVSKCKSVIDFARSACDVNYAMWSLLIEALLAELNEDFSTCVNNIEAAIDHCEVHGFPLEEAIALEMHGDFLVRRGAKRPARAMVKEAIAAWMGLGAIGKAEHLAEKHEWLLKTATAPRQNDATTQTVDSLANIGQTADVEPPALQEHLEDDRKKHWLESTGTQVDHGPLDIPSVGLDIIDLSSILEFSQVMSSELQIDKLLTKMIEIMLESCSGSDTAVISTEFEDTGFAISATGSLDDGQKAFVDGLPFSEMEDKIASQITHYTLRTKQEVLVHNVLEDERFSIINEGYHARYPLGRSIITLPIIRADSLLGVVHIEGKPNSFTQRNVVVLRLLCNQVGISLSNALLFRKVRKVSATNAAMVESQKRALAQAREAEQKAKIAEAEANHNVKLKEDAARAKSVFLANVSHDLRTPMNGVIGLSELLKGTKLDKEQDGYVESIRVCADTLLTLINDILDFSKLEAGKMKISTVPLNLKETISEVVRALRYTHRDRGLETIEDLDKLPGDLVVMGDPVRLHQIFMNLLSNSYKFTPKGHVKVAATVAREGKNRVRLECSVADTGIGISDEHKSRLFRPFSQADNSTARSYGGSGLGLSICKAIIEDVLGGLIWLDSKSGVGTTVTFQLVFQKAPKEATVAAPWLQSFNQANDHDNIARITQVITRDLTLVPRDQIRVCIAEDNPINQKIAVKFVRGLDLECEAFSDGQQAVEALGQRSKEGRPFHLVLMDVQMPVLDGYDATREIRKHLDPNVNQALVIAMTASAIEGDREKCLEAGMNNYLAKPVRSSVLSEMLDQYLAPARPSKIRRRPLPRNSSDDVGTLRSMTSSSSASQVIALTPENERPQPRMSTSSSAEPNEQQQQLPERLNTRSPEKS